MVNGGHKGTAGYGNDRYVIAHEFKRVSAEHVRENSWAIGQSYADEPLTQSW
jgi:hypothetical protein